VAQLRREAVGGHPGDELSDQVNQQNWLVIPYCRCVLRLRQEGHEHAVKIVQVPKVSMP
jgi:hypothetical protein